MSQSRRTVVRGAVAGIVGLLAGCVNSTEQSGDDSASVTKDGSPNSDSDTPPSANTDRTGPSTVTETTGPLAATEPAPTDQSVNVELTKRTGALTIVEINPNPPGIDRRRLFQEYVVFRNTENRKLDISGYTIDYGKSGRTYTYSTSYKTSIPAGMTFRLSTGTSGETILAGEYEVFAGFDVPVLSNDGGTITVTDADGTVVLEATYSPE